MPPAPGSVIAAWSLATVVFDVDDGDVPPGPAPPVEVLGRFRKARHALELRQRASSASLIARRYASRPCLRCSRRIALELVFANQDFGGNDAGGGRLVCEVREVWKVVKSE